MTIRMKSVRLLPAILIGLGISTSASAECRDEWICVDTISEGDNVELRARNLRNYPITFTLSVRSGDQPQTVTRTLAPQQSEQVMQLTGAGGKPASEFRISYD